eukprot:TRINITY_DN29267_c0_g1_i2.p1 TRINITY_DN29267_c0_g1~~TRINITY_DN29267_c0_g1_i2.p1  ORF type:complete len:332 (+),score=40.33 TRINITY_DN29267_c0_g1_i2:246-1241(+)
MGPKHLLHRDHPVTRHLAWVPIPVTILLVATVWSHQLLPPALRDTLLGDGNAGIAQLGSFGSELTRGLLAVARAERDSEERRAVKLEVLELLRAHMWVPTIATLLYVSLVQLGPRLMRHRAPFKLGTVLAAWNFGLAFFSVIGAMHCGICLILSVRAHGWKYSICTHPTEMELHGTDMDLWACGFVLSKLAEFGDTGLKIAMKKRITFLHWFHHGMTAWIGWLSLASGFAPGMLYSAVNFGVHGPMYFYYFLSSVLHKPTFVAVVSPFAPIITISQIAQMFTFLFVNGLAYTYVSWDSSTCHVQLFNLYLNAAVVAIYLGLFVSFFLSRYL